MRKLRSLPTELAWQARRLGYFSIIDTLLLWALISVVWFVALRQYGLTLLAAGLASLYLGELIGLSLVNFMARPEHAAPFFHYTFTYVSKSRDLKRLHSRVNLAWSYARRWLDRQLVDSEFRERFLLRPVIEDDDIPEKQRPASGRAMLWATFMELVERASEDSPPWSKTAPILAGIRGAFETPRIDSRYRRELANVYRQVSPAYRAAAREQDTGKPPSFTTAHPILTVLLITIASSAIAGVFTILASVLR